MDVEMEGVGQEQLGVKLVGVEAIAAADAEVVVGEVKQVQ